MKFIPALLSTLILSSALSLSAAAAEPSITVQINRQTLDLRSQAPVKENGSVLIPLRSIFEKLGLQIVWDAKTGSIKGSKEGLLIKLQLGSKRASINGINKPLASAPKMINNAVYVPLRFVSEATGGSVKWDAKQNTVIITTKQQNGDPKAISAFFDQYVAYTNKEDFDGFMSLIDPNSPLAQIGPQIKDQMGKYDLTLSLDQLDIVKLQPNEAIIHTVESSHKINGPFMPDERVEYIYQLIKNENGQDWKISSLQITGVQYNLPPELLAASPAVPQDEENQILSVLQANLKSSNDENLDGVLSTLDETSPQFEQNKQVYSQIFAAYDLAFTIESSKIIDYTENEAAVYVVQTAKKLKGPDFQDNRSTSVITFSKTKDGTWKIKRSYLIKGEKLTS
ncbi:ketosteroid isomerase-like protein [Paenibacillus forsythiae]|uniref:Ketosteroid isomerase-like protein n=1 Tax=Paenibacillus forsythiae TaxID=365616 RepID=A0ABU3HBD4_9BACL|nr:copper amine oxidase N-terminal domain-containing protein [Paenibacillus forsythiae]MDT3428125.1 ketosteroid isomerase-like protein [Paenibacillus forsythiae]